MPPIRRFAATVSLATVAVLILNGCASSGDSTSGVGASAVSESFPESIPSTEAPPPDVSSPEAPRSETAADGSWVMPNEVGKGLQDAQDDVQRASGDPIFVSHSHDLIRDRFQILDRDWQVCSQNVAPGTKVGPAAHIDFGVVKIDETCP
jgi:hypothetical protein